MKDATIQGIYKDIIQHYLKPTPLQKSDWLSEFVEGEVYLKLENLNPIGSFKARGALNAIYQLHQKHATKHENTPIKIVAASAGNHAQGVAYAAKMLGCEAHIFLPVNASPMKREATQKLGAKIYNQGENFDEAYEAASRFAETENAHYINAFNDENIILGQATCALEAHAQWKKQHSQSGQTSNQDPDFFLCSIGGGGLAAGACLYFNQTAKTKVIGAEHESYNSAFKSLAKKSLESTDLCAKSTIADGIAVKKIGTLTFKYLLEFMDTVITVSENEIFDAVAKIYKHENIVVEGAGAASIAALLKYPEMFKHKSTILCISGGNIDQAVFQKVLQHAKDTK